MLIVKTNSSASAIILAIISFLSGLGWILDRKKHRQEIESLKADNRQKDMNLSRDYVTEWRTYIAEPLTIVDLCRDSAMSESELSPLRSLLRRFGLHSTCLPEEVSGPFCVCHLD